MILKELIRWTALLTAWPYQLILFKRKTYYEDKKEQGRMVRGGALVISNHYHVYDYMMSMFLFPFRKLYVVMAEMIFKKGKFFHWLMDCFGGICSRRDLKGMKFIDDSVKVLEKGKLVQIFPEAHITKDGNMLEFKPSYLLIALRADVPILPVIVDGNYGFLKRAHVIIGKKIYLSDYCTTDNPSREELMRLNEMVRNKALELKAQLDENIARDRRKGKKQKNEKEADR